MKQGLERLTLPTFGQLLADFGNPSPHQLGRYLGVHARTVERWQASDCAPRAAVLALFWLSSWGLSELGCSTEREAAAATAYAAALAREVEALRRELARVLAVGDFGAANRPTLRDTALELMAARWPQVG